MYSYDGLHPSAKTFLKTICDSLDPALSLLSPSEFHCCCSPPHSSIFSVFFHSFCCCCRYRRIMMLPHLMVEAGADRDGAAASMLEKFQ